ncbi:PPCK2, partial [Symbiodinium pilosum]
FAAGTAKVERITWNAASSADCTNHSSKLPETKVDGVYLTRTEGEKDWAADAAKSPVKVDSKDLFTFVVLKTPQQQACGEDLVARIDELSVLGETVAACKGQLTGRESGEDKADTSHLKFQCAQQDVNSCNEKYTRTSHSKYIQCGVSDTNCLSIGPLCTPE